MKVVFLKRKTGALNCKIIREKSLTIKIITWCYNTVCLISSGKCEVSSRLSFQTIKTLPNFHHSNSNFLCLRLLLFHKDLFKTVCPFFNKNIRKKNVSALVLYIHLVKQLQVLHSFHRFGICHILV